MDDNGLGGRLPLLSPDKLEPAADTLYDRLVARQGSATPFRSRTDAGELLGPFNACLYAPAIGTGFIDFHDAEAHATPLPPRLREVVILSVGAVWGSAYELYAHRAVAQRAGFPADVVAALAAGETSDQLSGEERATQRLALELTRERHVSNETYAAAEDALGREALVAAVFLAAAYTGTCVMLNAFAVPAPEGDQHAPQAGK